MRRRCAAGFARSRLLVIRMRTALLGVGVNANVASEFIATAEALLASRVCADVGLLARVSSDVSSLVLKTVEGTRAEWTLVRPGDLRLVDGVVACCEGSSVGARIGHVGSGGLSHCEKRDLGLPER